MPSRRAGAAAREADESGTFAEMYVGDAKKGAGAGAGVWAEPRPELRAVGGGSDARQLDPILKRDLSRPAVEKLYDALDHVAPTLKPNDRAVYVVMVRRSYGAGRETCLVNLPLYADLSQLSQSGVQYALRRLIQRGLISEVARRGGRQEQGVEYAVFVPVPRRK